MKMDRSDIERLLAECIDGSDEARARFYNQFADLVRHAIRRTLGESPAGGLEADDLCHEVFIRLFRDDCRRLRQLENPGVLNAWLITVTRNYVVSVLRGENARERLHASLLSERQEPYGASPSELSAIAEEHKRLILDNLAALSDPDRLVLDLYYLHQLKYAEIADILSLNINTVSARIRRAKVKLRALLEEEWDDFVRKSSKG